VKKAAQDSAPAKDTFMACVTRIQNKLSQNREIMQKDVGHEQKLLKESVMATKMKECIEIVDLLSSQSQESRDEDETTTEEAVAQVHQRKKYLMMTKWQLFSGNDLDSDIALSRSLSGGNVFVADQGAAFLIQSFKLTDDWGRCRRMFRSAFANNNKPPGMYLIPLFRGESGGGHWSTVLVWRQGRRNRGYHLDSLGKVTVTGTIFDKIRCVFTGKRDQFSWVQTDCHPQEELDSGFRTVEAIRTICIGRSKGEGEEECIRKAGSAGTVPRTYCPMALRRKVAEPLLSSG